MRGEGAFSALACRIRAIISAFGFGLDLGHGERGDGMVKSELLLGGLK